MPVVQVRLLKAAGAVVLAKANMAEWAFDPDISIGSAFGVVRNPYDLDHVTAGSSGGTAAGDVSALFLFCFLLRAACLLVAASWGACMIWDVCVSLCLNDNACACGLLVFTCQ